MSTQVKDALVRALHTFWQFFAAALVVAYGASGVNLAQVRDVDSAKRVALALLGAVAAAALSAAKSTAGNLLSSRVAAEPVRHAAPDDAMPDVVAPDVAAVIAATVPASTP